MLKLDDQLDLGQIERAFGLLKGIDHLSDESRDALLTDMKSRYMHGFMDDPIATQMENRQRLLLVREMENMRSSNALCKGCFPVPAGLLVLYDSLISHDKNPPSPS